MRQKAVILFIAAAALGVVDALAADLEIVVDRHEDAVELFVATPASTFEAAFGVTPGRLTNADGLVEIDPLRQGTWDIGDALFKKTRAEAGGDLLAFEAMSFMVHPTEDRVPMRDPFEAVVAASVCTVDLPGQAFALSDLHGYAGFIAYTEHSGDDLLLHFAETGRGGLEVSVRTFTRGRETGYFRMRVPDGGSIVIPDGQDQRLAVWAAMLALCGLSASAGTVAFRRYRRHRLQNAG